MAIDYTARLESVLWDDYVNTGHSIRSTLTHSKETISHFNRWLKDEHNALVEWHPDGSFNTILTFGNEESELFFRLKFA